MKRAFLLVSLAATIGWSVSPCLSQQPTLEEQFKSPPTTYGPSCNWWWFGGAYSKDDIRENLNAMKAAGLGGFRIFPVYPLTKDDPTRGIRNAPYLSPEFLELVQEAVRYGTEISLTPDTLLGDGWPFGGPYIPPELGAGQLKFYSQAIEGPQAFTGKIPGSLKSPERLLAVQAAEISRDGGVRLETVVDLTSRLQEGAIRDWQVPAGRWLLMTFVGGYTGMKVKRASVGGEGLVLDHFSREALELHLKHNGDVQSPVLSGAKTIFMDSWEVFGSNWTPRLPEEFARRRGYSLIPYLAALFLPTSDAGASVRYDFRKTISELALENFYAPLNDWAHQNGFQTRVQAHGTPADILEAYGLNDFPEAESYGEEDRRRINIRDRKLASSAAHLFGRNEISAESFTWLRCPSFLVTLENMKAAADALYLDGINQIYYHGVPLSPSWAEPPGWYYYAATYAGTGNTWWPYLGHLSDYVRRADFLLQQGKPVVKVAVYLPIEDVWSGAYGDWHDLAGGLEKQLSEGGDASTAAMLGALQDGGFDFDFINASRIAGSRVDGGVLRVGLMDYRVVILPKIEAIEPKTLERLRDFARAGGAVIAVHRIPKRAPGYVDAEKKTAQVKDLSRELFGDISIAGQPPWRGELRARGNKCGEGVGVFVPPDPYLNLAPHASPLPRVVAKIIPPDSVIEPRNPAIGFVHRETSSHRIFFIANVSAHAKHVRARFHVAGEAPYVFDALTGSIHPLYEFRMEDGFTEARLDFEPWESKFVIFRREKPTASVTATNVKRILRVADDGLSIEAEVDLNGDFRARTGAGVLHATVSDLPAPTLIGSWHLSGNAVDKDLPQLVSWTEFAELRDFSGTATYRSRFALAGSYFLTGTKLELDLGEVHDIAAVSLNGKACGVAWKRPYRVEITGAAKPGANELEIRVTNSLMNRMRVKKLSEADRPPSMSPEMLRDYVPQPVPSGLIGPVQLRVSRRITLRAGAEK